MNDDWTWREELVAYVTFVCLLVGGVALFTLCCPA